METLVEFRSKLEAARAMGDAERVEELLDFFVGFGKGLERALQRYGDKIAEAASANNVRLLGELYEGLRQLRLTLIEWRLVAEELGVFSQASASGSADSGGGSCSPCAPAASFTEGSDA